MADQFDLSNLLAKQSQYQAAKYGGGGLLDMAINAYQAAFPHAPAANLAMGARQAYNIGKYNQAVQAAQQDELNRVQGNRQVIGKKYADMGMDTSTGTDKNGNPVYTLDLADYKQLAPDYGNAQGIEALRRGADGKDPQPGYLAPLDKMQQWYQDNVMKPNIENSQNIATLNQINQKNPYDTGTQNPGQAVVSPPQPQGLASIQPQEGQPLTAGAVAQGPPPPPPVPPISPMDRFLSQNYAGNPATIVSGATQKETAAHNGATEKQAINQLKETNPTQPDE